MVFASRVALKVALVVSFVLLVLLVRHFADILGQYRTPEYIWSSLRNDNGLSATPMSLASPEDKIIVLAKLEKEDTEWVKDLLPELVQSYARVDARLSI